MYLKVILIFHLAILHEPFFCYGKVAMADDPVTEYLRVHSETEYEFLGKDVLHQLDKRDLHGETPLKVYTMNESIDLLLNPSNSDMFNTETPFYLLKVDPESSGGVYYQRNEAEMRSVGTLLEDPKHLASLVINKDEYNRITVNGVARSRRHDANLVIRTLPDSVVQEHLRKRRSTNSSADQHFSQSPHHANHVIYKIKDEAALNKSRKAHKALERTQIAPALSEVHRHAKREAPADFNGTLYVKLLIHLDSTYFDVDSENKLRPRYSFTLMEYFLAFWNSVELTYRNLDYPRFQFTIAAITLAQASEATPYIAKALKSRDGKLDDVSLLNLAKDFYYEVRNQIPLNTYDVAVTMTQLPLADHKLGTAARGSICSDPAKRGRQEAVALITDSYGFDGVRTAVHELGHILGSPHDGSKTSFSCSASKGYLMAREEGDSPYFSSCSRAKFDYQLRKNKFKCLYNKTTTAGKSLPLLAAGKMLSMDRQCQAQNFTRACSTGTKIFCKNLKCHNGYITHEYGEYESCKSRGRAAPGTPCDTGIEGKLGICFMYSCVAAD